MSIPQIPAPGKGGAPSNLGILTSGKTPKVLTNDDAEPGWADAAPPASKTEKTKTPPQWFLDNALSLAAHGFRVFPLAPGKKKPALQAGWKRIATTDPKMVRALWTDPRNGVVQPYNIGIATGDALVVIDVDVKDGVSVDQRIMVVFDLLLDVAVPETFAVATWSGGRHIYLNVPSGERIPNSTGDLHDFVDVRGDGGYVVGPGSRIDGAFYTALGDTRERANAPDRLIEACKRGREWKAEPRARDKSQDGVELDTPLATERAIACLKRAKPAIQGAHGDNHTIVVANLAMDFAVSPGMTTELMLEHWNERCSPPWDPFELRYKVFSAWRSRQDPVGKRAPEAEFEPVDPIDRRMEANSEPANLWEKSTEPPCLERGCLPETLEMYAAGKAERIGSDWGSVAVATLAGLASLIPAGNTIQMYERTDEWPLLPIVWTCLVGRSGSAKSSVFKLGASFPRKVDAIWQREYTQAKDLFELARERENRRRKALPKNASETSSDDVIESTELKEPICRRKITSDATTEAIFSLLADNPDGLLFASDELKGWFAGMDLYHEHKTGKDRSIWLEAKDGGERPIDRKKGSIRVPRNAVHILGGIQPVELAKMLQGTGDGLMQRFHYAFIGGTGIGVDTAPDPRLDEILERIAILLANTCRQKTFRLALNARVYLDRINDFKFRETRREDYPQTLSEWCAKAPNEFGRLALVFHFIEWASMVDTDSAAEGPPERIAAQTAERAYLYVTRYLFGTAKAVFAGKTSPTFETAIRIAGHILARGREHVDCRSLEKALHTDGSERAKVIAAMSFLEAEGWAYRKAAAKNQKWDIDKRVHDGRFKAIADAERERRDAAMASAASASG